MHSRLQIFRPSFRRFRARPPCLLFFGAITLWLTARELTAGTATWSTAPFSGDWNTAANWNPATVPNASSDTATFGQTNNATVTLSASVEVNGILFGSGASACSINAPAPLILTISGLGVTNNSGLNQNLVTGGSASQSGVVQFLNGA